MGILDTIGRIGSDILPMLGPIGGVASTLIDAASQRSTNAQNEQNVRQQEQFQNTESSTSYQRAVADMKAAGLNPALAYQQGGASTPTGGAATFQAPFQNTASKLSTALDTYNTLASGVAQRDLLREQANAASAQARLNTIQGSIQQPQAEYNTTGAGAQAIFKTLDAEQKQRLQQAQNYPTQFGANLNLTKAQTGTAAATSENLRTQSTLNEQSFQNTWFRKNIAPYVNSTAATLKATQPLIRITP